MMEGRCRAGPKKKQSYPERIPRKDIGMRPVMGAAGIYMYARTQGFRRGLLVRVPTRAVRKRVV